jgi:lysophospholipase L1-like esterase
MNKILFIIVWIVFISNLSVAQDYLFFTDSDNPVYYDPSYLYSNTPSTLLKVNSVKFPVSVDTFYSLTNALKLQWKSMTGGDWGSAIAAPGWPGRDITIMDSISFWLFTPQTIVSAFLPKIYLEDLSNQKTAKINLSDYSVDINPGEWTNIKVPLDVFVNNPGLADLTRIKVIYLGQGIVDSIQHTMFIDEVKITGNYDPNTFRNIVVLGSSTAAGTGPTNPDSAWVNRLRNYLTLQDTTIKVINLAVGGYTTYNVMPTGFIPPLGRPTPGIYNNISYALTYNPIAILINLPSNDAANYYPIAEQIANYDTLVNILTNNQVSFWMSTTQPRNFTNQSQLNLLFAMNDSTYSRYGNHAVDFWTDIAQANGWINPIYNSGDGIHLNDAAHRILYERMLSSIYPALLDVDDNRITENDFTFELNNNFPNPFNPSTTISWNSKIGTWQTLKVYDVLGNEVSLLVNEFREAGNHQVKFQLKVGSHNLASGVYYYQLIAGDFIQTKKMIVLK